MAQKAHDKAPADAKLLLPALQRPLDTAEHGSKGDTAGSVGLRVEEDLHMHHLVGGATLKIGPGEVEEVLLGHQHAGTAIVEVEKGLQAVKVIGGAHAGHVGPGQRHIVAFAKLEHQLGFEGALNVKVQLQLGQFGYKVFGNRVIHGDGSISDQIPGQPLHTIAPTSCLLCAQVARQGRLVIKQIYNGVTKIIND